MRVLYPPKKYFKSKHFLNNTSIFLAGSIEMGVAEDWQSKVIEAFEGCYNIDILNPRRTDWDSSWEQKITNPQFHEQVSWELDCLEKCDIILMHFSPGTQSPISLLELGLFHTKKMVVCCPEGFWRKGNVDIVCERYSIPVLESLDDAIQGIKEELWLDTV